MNRKLLLIFIFIFTLSGVVGQEPKWHENIDTAFAEAQATGKVVFVDIYTTWCSWCKKLEQETFVDPRFKQMAANFVLLKIDAEKEYDFCSKYKVRAYPTMLFIKSDGSELKRKKGFIEAAALVELMQEVLPTRNLSWNTNIQDTLQHALENNRLVFIDVYTNWCSWCERLEKETFNTENFKKIAANFVLLKIDAEKEYAFCSKYHVRAYPTMLVLKGNGEELLRIKGFRTAEQLIPELEKLLGRTASTNVKWFKDIAEAFKNATQKKQLLFVDFYTDWCSWCKKLDKETFSHSTFKKIATKFTLLKVNADKEIEFRKKYQVSKYPTMLIINAEGKEVGRIIGFKSASQLVAILKKFLK